MRAATAVTAATALLAAAAAGVGWAAARSRPLVPDTLPPDPPPLPPARTVAVPGHGELFVRELPGPRRPGAPTILLLHGWMFPSDLNWFTCYEPLAEVGRVLAVDHRGHGRGTRPASPFRLVDAADDAAALVRHLDAGPVIAVGYSMGGPVAQLLWRRHPDVVRGLVLCATSATFTETARDRWQWRLMGVLQLILRLAPRHQWEQLIRLQTTGELPVRLTRMIHPDTPEEVKALLPWVFAELDRGSAEDIAEAGREMGRYDARAWIGDIDVPTTVLATMRDRLVPPHRQQALARAIPGARLVELPLDHDAVVGGADRFVPALVDAVEHVDESWGLRAAASS